MFHNRSHDTVSYQEAIIYESFIGNNKGKKWFGYIHGHIQVKLSIDKFSFS